MTSRELTSSIEFWSCGHLRMAVMRLPIKFDTYIFIQSRVIDIFFEIQDGRRRHLNLLGGAMGPPTKANSWCVVRTPV